MPTVDVYGNSPNTGPGRMTAEAVRDDINQANPGWGVTMAWTADTTQFKSAIAPGQALKSAVETRLKGYLYSLSDLAVV